MRHKFINDGEQLLVWTTVGEHISYPANMERAAEALAACDSFVEKFFRVDREWNFEDVTEEVAQAWLDRYGEHPDDLSSDEPWLTSSQAWDDYPDTYRETKPQHRFCGAHNCL